MGDKELLAGLDYQGALVAVEDLAKVPSFKPPVSFLVEESTPRFAGDSLPTFCGGEKVEVLGGYEEDLNGYGAPGYEGLNVSVSFTLAAIDSPKAG